MDKKEVVVACKRVKFFSGFDETVFFESINKIRSVKGVKGVKDEIHLLFKNNEIWDEDLCDLISLFRRYKIPVVLLEPFVNDDNRERFESFQKYVSINVYPSQKVV